MPLRGARPRPGIGQAQTTIARWGPPLTQVIQELLKGHEFTDTAEEKAPSRQEAQFYSEMKFC